MTSLEMDLIRREADDRARRARDLFGRMGCPPGPVQVGELSWRTPRRKPRSRNYERRGTAATRRFWSPHLIESL
jgi:hypothetical protein